MATTTNKLGHRMGARGGRTRQALLDAGSALLRERSFGAVRTADVAQTAGVSPASFYTYFSSVDDIVLALCEAATEDCNAVARHLQGDWSGDRAFVAAREYVAEVLTMWRAHGHALRIEHMLADQGHAAFADSRIRRLRRLHLALERRIAEARAGGRQPEGLDPRLASYQVANMVESMADGFDLLLRADTAEAVLDTTAHMVVRLTTGR